MNNEAPETYEFKLKDGRLFKSLFSPEYLEEVGVCYVFFNWVASMELVFSDKSRSEHSPVIFQALSRLTAKGYVENLGPSRWRSKREAMVLARSYEAFSLEQKEWVMGRLSND